MTFDRIVMVDWNAGADTGPTPKKDAIWIGFDTAPPAYMRNRAAAEAAITDLIDATLGRGETLCLGFDFGFAYPAGFAKALIGTADPFALWDWLAARVDDSPKSNNRFDLAGQINATFPGSGPFWGNGLRRDIPNLPRKGSARTFHWPSPKRAVERQAPGTFECWQLSGAGAVGSQIIMGLPLLSRLRHRYGPDLTVWPFEARKAPVTLVEIWPSLIAAEVKEAQHLHPVRDAVQVTLLARALSHLGGGIAPLFDVPQSEEGWILGVGHEPALKQAAQEVLRR